MNDIRQTGWRFRLVVGVALIAMAFGVAWMLRPGASPETLLHDTAGIEVIAGAVHYTLHGLAVPCIVENHTDRQAASIVFSVDVLDAQGTVIASNPLANVLDLAPHASCEIAVPLFINDPPPIDYRVQTQVNLVRWRD